MNAVDSMARCMSAAFLLLVNLTAEQSFTRSIERGPLRSNRWKASKASVVLRCDGTYSDRGTNKAR